MTDNGSILLVDDEKNILRSLTRSLTSWCRTNRLEILTAESGDEAFEVLREKQDEIPLIISDQKMPGIKGSDFLKIVADRYPHILTIILTGQSSIADMGSIVKAGVFSFITKPWEKDTLMNEVDKAFRVYELRKKNRIL